MRILFCGDAFPAAPRRLEQRLDAAHHQVIVAPAEGIEAFVAGTDVAIPLMCRIDAALMDAGGFRLIHQWGAGLEGVDLEAAKNRGIQVANVPTLGKNADSVAEHSILLALAVLRQLPVAQSSLQSRSLGAPLGRMLSGRTVCLYGLGAVAGAIARRLRSFDVRLVGITRDPGAPKVAVLGLDACYSTADRREALAQTDVLILCVPLAPETEGIIDEGALAALRPGAVVVNAARGALMDYNALRAALESGHLGGAGLDVFWEEPFSPLDPLLALPNVIATPHIAGVTDGSYDQIADAVAANIERLRRGEPLLNLAT